jgi:hypothetical protein
MKGVSDAADSKKDREDAKGYWRELAKENPVRFLMALIRRGRIRALRSDEFMLDPTAGTPAEARAVIKDVSAPGVSLLAFPSLVGPLGPLTELTIGMEARDPHGGILSIIAMVVVFVDHHDAKRQMRIEHQVRIKLPGPIGRDPIGVFALVQGTAAKIVFDATTSAGTQHAEWHGS